MFGMLGTLAELILLEHYEDRWQYAPLVLLVVGVVATGAHLAFHRESTARALRLVMVLFVLAGLMGLYQHYSGNVEFEREMYPSLAGVQLVWGALTGATPALAPGSMILLGLVGLASGYRMPRPSRES